MYNMLNSRYAFSLSFDLYLFSSIGEFGHHAGKCPIFGFQSLIFSFELLQLLETVKWLAQNTPTYCRAWKHSFIYYFFFFIQNLLDAPVRTAWRTKESVPLQFRAIASWFYQLFISVSVF